jgi:predicted membrane-bound mannosyltransferase
MSGSALRQATFAVITAAYFGVWILIFWSTIVAAVEARDVGSLRPLAILHGIGVAVALLLPMSGSSAGRDETT